MCTVARTHNSRFFASGADVSTIGYVHCPATVPAFEYKLSDRKKQYTFNTHLATVGL